MATPVFALHFVSPRKAKDRPFAANARIAVEGFTQDTAEGLPFIAAGASSKELDDAVDALIKELKSVRKEARRRFEGYEKDFGKAKKVKSKKRK